MGQQKFLTFLDLKLWMFVLRSDNMPCLFSVKRQQKGVAWEASNGLFIPSFEMYQATSMVAITSASILLLSYFQNISTEVKLEDFKAAFVLLFLLLLL